VQTDVHAVGAPVPLSQLGGGEQRRRPARPDPVSARQRCRGVPADEQRRHGGCRCEPDLGIGAGHQPGEPVERGVECPAARPGRGAHRVVREPADAHPEQQPVAREVLHRLDLRRQPQHVPGRHVDHPDLDVDPIRRHRNRCRCDEHLQRRRAVPEDEIGERHVIEAEVLCEPGGGEQIGGVVEGQADADLDGRVHASTLRDELGSRSSDLRTPDRRRRCGRSGLRGSRRR
jgi:hypothetical protein